MRSPLDKVKSEPHPAQLHRHPHYGPQVNADVVRAAYEVYCYLYGEQEAMVTGNCRGGLGLTELIAFLYARPFPKSEWRKRVDEAFRDMRGF